MTDDSAVEASALTLAVGWVEQLLLGSIATSVAALAIAVVGGMMLAGRADWRRGMRVIAGCFVVFGAGAIANALTGLGTPSERAAASAPPPPLPPSIAAPNLRAQAFDPYAGAALVRRPLGKDDLRPAPFYGPPNDAAPSMPVAKR